MRVLKYQIKNIVICLMLRTEHIQVNFHDCAKRLESILDYLEMVV